MDFKYGLVFWVTCAMLLVGTPQMLMVEGLECEVCVRFSNVPDPANQCLATLWKTRANRKSQEFVDQEKDAMMPEVKEAVMKEVWAKMKDQPRGRSSEPNTFVCGKLLAVMTFPDIPVDDKMMTVGMCSPSIPSMPARAEPYDKLPGRDMREGFKKQAWHLCDEKNLADCHIDETRDLKNMGMPTPEPATSSTHSTYAAWILITFSCFLAAAAAAAVDLGIAGHI